jgi:2-polyprenyl-3-methyl-5-hydroxy-6-metoxy-1,4-benzoquinol methylase
MFGYQLYYSSINPQPKQNRRFYKIYGVMHVGERLRFLHVIKLINQKIQSPNEILDAGAGNGNYIFYVRKVFPKAKITGIDISKGKIANISNIANLLNLKKILFDKKTLTNLKGKQKYDLVLCIDVLEHIKNDILAIKNISESLKPRGSLILHVPKDRKLVYRHLKRFKEFNIEDHVREEYRIEEILDKIKKSGLRVKKFSYTLGWFGSLAWEIDQLLIVHLRKVRYITFPILYVLILADVYITNNNGNGFLFHCVKE